MEKVFIKNLIVIIVINLATKTGFCNLVETPYFLNPEIKTATPSFKVEWQRVYEKRIKAEQSGKRTNPSEARNILELSDDEILNLIRPRNGELKKHSIAVWTYARKFAEALGIEHGSREMNLLRVICLAHDIGGVLGCRREDHVDNSLCDFAKKHEIDFLGINPSEVLEALINKGLLDNTDITEDELKEFVERIDHQSNSIRILDRYGIILPKEVRFIISRHNDALTNEELMARTELERQLFICFMMADSLEKGNNFYKHTNENGELVEEFENAEVFIGFIKGTPEKTGKMEGRTSVQQSIDVLADLVLKGELEDEIRRNSRTPIEETIFGEQIEIRRFIQEAMEELPENYVNNEITLSGEQSSMETLLSKVLGEEICIKGSAFVFSEKITFNYGLGILLPKLAKAGLPVGVVAINERQKKIIDELNEIIPYENNIKCADSVIEVLGELSGIARYYYFRVQEDTDENFDVNGVIIYDITDKIEIIIDSIGKICEVESELLKKLHDVTRRFAQAA